MYKRQGNGLFIDEAPRSAIGRTSLLTLAFGCLFLDYDLDGYLDLFAVNGHVSDDIEHVQARVTYAQPPHLFRNRGDGNFEEVLAIAGSALAQPMVARGAAYGDIDKDGDLDLVVTRNNGPARLLRNNASNEHHLLRILTTGTVSNRDGIGARVEIEVADGSRRWQLVKTGSSYASQSELAVTFGLESFTSVNTVRVLWPSGIVDKVDRVAANHELTIQEGSGVIDIAPLTYVP